MNKKQKTKHKIPKTQKGITLVALVITIIVLLILAVVAIRAIQNDSIINYAKNSVDEYERAQENEQTLLQGYIDKIEEKIGTEGNNPVGSSTIAMSDAQGKVLSTTENKEVKDAYGNIIKVPAGFKITTEANNVTEGIVVEDATVDENGNPTVTNGSQFVWIPVGNVYTTTDEVKTEANTVEIKLSRYIFANGTSDKDTNGNVLAKGTPIDKGTEAIDTYYQELAVSEHGNEEAKELDIFLTKASKGYYIGRYEARTTTERSAEDNPLTTLTCKKSDYVYNYVTQSQASSLSQGMYTNKPYTSDLVNSYAWDTAIVFLQTFDDRTETQKTTPYSYQTRLENRFFATGTDTDVICNIYDMASNCIEWTTEASSYVNSSTGQAYPCIYRGDAYYDSYRCPGARRVLTTAYSYDGNSFRPLLYL